MQFFRDIGQVWRSGAIARDAPTERAEGELSEASTPPLQSKRGGASGEPPFPLPVTRESLTMLELIGHGSFGTVSKAMAKNGHVVAVKRVKVDLRFMSREAQILELVAARPHRNVVRFYGAFTTRKPTGESVEYLVMEYLSGNLRGYIATNAPVPLASSLALMHQFFSGLAAVHKLGVCHRDLKPENLLVDAEGTLKLCDFGSAKQLSAGAVAGVTYIASRPYRAPELLCKHERYTDAIDVWASGCILAELLCGEPIFSAINNEGVLARQLQIRGSPTVEWFAELCGNADAMSLFQDKGGVAGSAWSEVLGRPHAKEEWSADVLACVGALLDSLLAWAPSARPRAVDAVDMLSALTPAVRRLAIDTPICIL